MGDWTPGGSTTQPGDPSQGGGNTGGGGTAPTGSSDALTTMNNTSWGSQAAAAAQSIGVNPNALAATCVLESSTCDSSAVSSTGAVGAFQMFPAAFQDGLNTALRANPSLASQIVTGPNGINDPLTESIAASGYLLQANQALTNADISNPTVVDARGYYEFGPSQGTRVAQASDDNLMSNLISSKAMSANLIPASETVGQWRASVAAKSGGAGSQSVATGS